MRLVEERLHKGREPSLDIKVFNDALPLGLVLAMRPIAQSAHLTAVYQRTQRWPTVQRPTPDALHARTCPRARQRSASESP